MSSIKDKRLFLLDMDGTLYLGDRLIEGAREFLNWVNETGRKYLFITNNSSKGVIDYVRKMERLGLPAKDADFVTSVQLCARFLKENYAGRKIYVLGTKSFKSELIANGIMVTDNLDEVDCLVMGFDTELTFSKLEDACRLLVRGVDYIATNPDIVCPTEFGSVPDCGSVAQMLYNATGRRPRFLGKPEPEILYMAIEKSGFEPSEALVIGDRMYTDIASGVRAGVDTALVLSGESTLEDVEKSEFKPTWIFDSIKECHQAIIN